MRGGLPHWPPPPEVARRRTRENPLLWQQWEVEWELEKVPDCEKERSPFHLEWSGGREPSWSGGRT
jgi:hypothetical protein